MLQIYKVISKKVPNFHKNRKSFHENVNLAHNKVNLHTQTLKHTKRPLCPKFLSR